MPPAKKTPAKKSDTLPGGYKVGDKVFFTGAGHTWVDGDKLVHGKQGEVTGPARDHMLAMVAVRFPGNKGSIDCFVTEVRRRRAAPAAKPMLFPHARDDASPTSFLLNSWTCAGEPSCAASRLAPPCTQRPARPS